RGPNKTLNLEFVEKSLHRMGCFNYAAPANAFSRIQIQDNHIGRVNTINAGSPGMEFKNSSLCKFDEPLRLIHIDICYFALRSRLVVEQTNAFNFLLIEMSLEETLFVSTVWAAHQ